jgi:putative ABC transport system permease protein
MKSKQSQPPRWAEAFLRWYCKPEILEDLYGDLLEYFERNSKSRGSRYARLVFAIDTIKFFRLYTVRKPSVVQLMIHRIMLGSYIKTSARSIAKNKLFSTINIVGLAISMSVALVMISVLTDMTEYDKYNQNYSLIYRIKANRGDNSWYASTSLKAANQIEQTISGIDKVAVLKRDFSGDFSHGETTIPLSGLWANPATLSVFTFPLVAGDAATALSDPFSVILTETSAKKMFGNGEALGKVIVLKDKQKDGSIVEHSFTVTGIMQDIPKFSHVHFEMLGSLNTFEKIVPGDKSLTDWEAMWDVYVYMLMPADADLTRLQKNLDVLCEKENSFVKTNPIHLSFQPLSSIALGEDLNNSIGPIMGTSEVWMIGVLALIVLLSACFNYTNLSIAKALNRAREVGVRKVIGAMRSHVVAQFVVESVIISLASLVAAFGIFVLARPWFLSFSSDLSEMLDLAISGKLIFWFLVMAAGTGLLAGIVPALFFSRLKAAVVLKNVKSLQAFKSLNIRKALVVVQYAVSIVFIAATLIGIRQYKHMLSFNLGYKTSDILNIRLSGNKSELLVKEFSEIPEVKGISKSQMITSIGNYWSAKTKYNDPADSIYVDYNSVDENYFPLHEHELISGRNFVPRPDSSSESEVIVNAAVLKHFNIADGDPVKALQEVLVINGKELQIVGVVRDFHYGKVDNKTDHVMFRQTTGNENWLNVKIESHDWPATLARLEMAWRKIDNVHPFDAKFYDDQIKESYNGISSMLKVIGCLAFLAICISSMGLLGMVVFTTETRLKEISIRKVMGAGEWKLVYLTGNGFIKLLLVATLIAIPATWFFFEKVALQELVNPAPIGVMDLFGGVIAILVIACIMIGTQTMKVARANPAEVLRAE